MNQSLKWDFSDIYRSDEDYEIKRKTIENANYQFINKWKDRKDYLTNTEILKEALYEYDNLLRDYGTDGDEGYYYWLRSQLDKTDTNIKARLNKIDDFSKRIQNDIHFFYLNISKIPKKIQSDFLNYKPLEPFKHFLERAFREAEYMLSEEEERIINLKRTSSYSYWVRMTSSFISKQERNVLTEEGKVEKKTFSEIISLLNSKNKSVRDKSARVFNKILSDFLDAAEYELNSILHNKKVDDEIRKMPRPDFDRHLNDDIESEIVDTLVDTVSQHFHISERFYELKARLLGVKKLKYHERNVEYGKIDKKFTFAESIEIISRVMKGLDDEFYDIFNEFINKGRFDVYPKKGKSSGAFCAHHLISQPTYILLNHNDKLNDVLTLAHELGHGINNELIKKKQMAINFGTPLCTAEVASTFMEDFVLREIMKDADDETRLAIMVKKLNDDVSTIFRQIACYRFEQELHNEFRIKGYLSKKEIGSIFQRHMAFYMGKYVEQSKGSENWWVYWGHIRTFFYVYSYASGLLISKSLQRFVNEDKRHLEKVKDFLSAGLSESPSVLFNKFNINIKDKGFWIKGLSEIEELLDDTFNLARRLKVI
ncbi:MAG TPA: M3 family oligoendopeptidase [Nitrospirae bacterium]|nr:M3 family oligoendopeptidase [Nitrospirota bacterium]